jgi:hypothetical protein
MDDVERNLVGGFGVALMAGAIAWVSTVSFAPGHSASVRILVPAVMFVIGGALVIWAVRSKLPAPAVSQTVSDEHRDVLRSMLTQAQNAIEANVPRGDRDPLEREMFSLHFPDLESRLAAQDGLRLRSLAAPESLRARFTRELGERELAESPYLPDRIAKGFTSITAGRALRAELVQPIPPALGSPNAIWRSWASDHVMAGMVDFNPYGLGGEGNVLAMEGESFPVGAREPRMLELLDPLRQLLIDAQEWEEAYRVPATRNALRDGEDPALLDDLRRALLRPTIPTVERCPGC